MHVDNVKFWVCFGNLCAAAVSRTANTAQHSFELPYERNLTKSPRHKLRVYVPPRPTLFQRPSHYPCCHILQYLRVVKFIVRATRPVPWLATRQCRWSRTNRATFMNILARYVEALQYFRFGRPVTSCVEQAPSLQADKVHTGKQRNRCDRSCIACINNLAGESPPPPYWAHRQPHYIHCRIPHEPLLTNHVIFSLE